MSSNVLFTFTAPLDVVEPDVVEPGAGGPLRRMAVAVLADPLTGRALEVALGADEAALEEAVRSGAPVPDVQLPAARFAGFRAATADDTALLTVAGKPLADVFVDPQSGRVVPGLDGGLLRHFAEVFARSLPLPAVVPDEERGDLRISAVFLHAVLAALRMGYFGHFRIPCKRTTLDLDATCATQADAWAVAVADLREMAGERFTVATDAKGEPVADRDAGAVGASAEMRLALAFRFIAENGAGLFASRPVKRTPPKLATDFNNGKPESAAIADVVLRSAAVLAALGSLCADADLAVVTKDDEVVEVVPAAAAAAAGLPVVDFGRLARSADFVECHAPEHSKYAPACAAVYPDDAVAKHLLHVPHGFDLGQVLPAVLDVATATARACIKHGFGWSPLAALQAQRTLCAVAAIAPHVPGAAFTTEQLAHLEAGRQALLHDMRRQAAADPARRGALDAMRRSFWDPEYAVGVAELCIREATLQSRMAARAGGRQGGALRVQVGSHGALAVWCARQASEMLVGVMRASGLKLKEE